MSSQNNDNDPYACVVQEKLKLKCDDSIFKKKNKKKKSKKFADSVKIMKSEEPVEEQKAPVVHRTKAQIAFEKQREKQQQERIKEKASKTHKQRVEEFNKHLDSLTEHFDIPKVSWTK